MTLDEVRACRTCAPMDAGDDECSACGRHISIPPGTPVFDLNTQRVMDSAISTVAIDWQPLRLTAKRGKVKIIRHVAGHDRAAQLNALLEAA